jgi:hypothetical protein
MKTRTLEFSEYTYNAAAKTVTSSYFALGINKIKLITNLVTGVVIYDPSITTKTGTLLGTVLTLNSTEGIGTSTDALEVIFEDTAIVLLVSPSKYGTTIGSLSSVNAFGTIIPHGFNNTAQVRISGTFVATYVIELSDDGTTWEQAPIVTKPATSLTSNYNSSQTSGGVFMVPMFGYTNIRVRTTAFTSGTLNLRLQFTQNEPPILQPPAPTNAINNSVWLNITNEGANAALYSNVSTLTNYNSNQYNLPQGAVFISVDITSVTGVGTVDHIVQYAQDGTTWVDFYHLERMTAAGKATTPLIHIPGYFVRVVRKTSGFTAVNGSAYICRRHGSLGNQTIRFFERSLNFQTLTAGQTFRVDNANKIVVQAVQKLGFSVPPIASINVSNNGVDYFNLSTIDCSGEMYQFDNFWQYIRMDCHIVGSADGVAELHIIGKY